MRFGFWRKELLQVTEVRYEEDNKQNKSHTPFLLQKHQTRNISGRKNHSSEIYFI